VFCSELCICEGLFENAKSSILDWNTNNNHHRKHTHVAHKNNSSIRIPGSQVIPIPLFHPLDGTKSEDYVARVEPSASGGRKMAEYMLDVIHSSSIDNAGGMGMMTPSVFSAPSTSFMDGRG